MPNRLIDGWDNRIERTGVHRPIISLILTLIVGIVFYRIGDELWLDLLTAGVISFAFLQGFLVVASLTEDWKWRIAGLLVSVGGVGLTYAFIFGNASGHTNVNTLAVRSTIRSSLFVGGIILILGTWGYIWNRRRGIRSKESFLDPRGHYRES
jgi:hypothetical protein